MKTLLALLVLVGTAGAQMCPADADGSGAVTVDEIVKGVNAALTGCPKAEYCGRTFATPGADDACAYSGTVSGGCDPGTVKASFVFEPESENVGLVFTDGTHSAVFAAKADNPYFAFIEAVSTDGQNFKPGGGFAYLSGDGSMLNVVIDGKAFVALGGMRFGGCLFDKFTGAFIAKP